MLPSSSHLLQAPIRSTRCGVWSPPSAHSTARTGLGDGRGSLTPSPRRLQLGCTQRMDSDTPGRQLIYDLLHEADYAVSGRACLAPKSHTPTKVRVVPYCSTSVVALALHTSRTRWCGRRPRQSLASSSTDSASRHWSQVSLSCDAALGQHTKHPPPLATCRACISGVFLSVPEYLPCARCQSPCKRFDRRRWVCEQEETNPTFWKTGRTGPDLLSASRSPAAASDISIQLLVQSDELSRASLGYYVTAACAQRPTMVTRRRHFLSRKQKERGLRRKSFPVVVVHHDVGRKPCVAQLFPRTHLATRAEQSERGRLQTRQASSMVALGVRTSGQPDRASFERAASTKRDGTGQLTKLERV